LLVIADAVWLVGAVEMTFPAAHESKVRLEPQVKREGHAMPGRQSAPVALGGYLPD
jgi:hypothetical protein